MSRLRRYHTDGNWYFITTVTYLRQPVLVENEDILLDACGRCCEKLPHELHAWVILPDHFHVVINARGSDISTIMQRIKMGFGANWRHRIGIDRGRVWQHRFWDHIIRDQNDLNTHIDYIHYNPVKHGLVESPFDWERSSLHHFHTEGLYDSGWGRRDTLKFDGDYGE